MNSQQTLRRLVGSKGRIRNVVFEEDGRSYECFVPDDSLWGAVKDNLILREYERAGIRLDRPWGLVVDAGAHVGLFSLRMAPYAERVVGLEPSPANFAVLQRNLERNNVRNVFPMQRALWSSVRSLTFAEGPQTGGGGLLGSIGGKFDVDTSTLEELIGQYGAIDLLKLDIEGAEFEVLAGATDETLANVGTILAELHLQDRDGQDRILSKRLQSLGFHVSVLPPPIFEWKQSLSRILRNWRKSRGLARTKAVILSVYAAAPLFEAVLGRDRLNEDRLAFLYAVSPRDGLR